VEGERLGSDIQENLRAFFDPLRGGPEDQGWPFGRDVYASEVYQVIEQTSGVDHVEALGIYTREPEDEWTIVSPGRRPSNMGRDLSMDVTKALAGWERPAGI
jgi:hypothetical protein